MRSPHARAHSSRALACPGESESEAQRCSKIGFAYIEPIDNVPAAAAASRPASVAFTVYPIPGCPFLPRCGNDSAPLGNCHEQIAALQFAAGRGNVCRYQVHRIPPFPEFFHSKSAHQLLVSSLTRCAEQTQSECRCYSQ